MSKEDNNEIIIDGGISIFGELVSAGVGLVVAGPAGSLIGAAVAPVVEGFLRWGINEAKENLWTKRQKNNIEHIVTQSIEQLSTEDTCDGTPLDDDWIARYYDLIKDIGSPELQIIWSKILAGEFLHSGSYSFRLLRTLSDITKDEAELIQKIQPFIIHHGDDVSFISIEKSLLDKFGIYIGELIRLESCGVIHIVPGTEFTEQFELGEITRNYYTSEYLVTMENNADSQISFQINNIYLITSVGMEFHKLLNCPPNNEYLLDWAKIVRSKAQDDRFAISLHKNTDGKNYNATPEISL